MNRDFNAKIETEEEFSADLIELEEKIDQGIFPTPGNLGEMRGFLKGLDTTVEREADRL